MNGIRILGLGTILVVGFAMAAQAQTRTTSENGDAINYQVGQPTSQQGEGVVGDAANYEIGQPDQQTADPEEKVTPAPAANDPTPMGNESLNPNDWSEPPSL
jgi:hypothetical protein